MKKTALLMAMAALAATFAAKGTDIDGATPGKWTMDLDAAKKMAAEKHLPILLDFSGSDWCGWCKLMEENVFTKPAWTAYATNNLMMVLVDFPNDKSLVPEKYVARNKALADTYHIEGFPTYILLDDDGTSTLGRLGAGQEKTPESFIAELNSLCRYRPAEIAAYAATLAPEKQAAYKKLVDDLNKMRDEFLRQQKALAEAQEKAKQLLESIGQTEEQVRAFRVDQLGADARKQFDDLKTRLDAANQKLKDWLATKPERTDENTKLFQTMQSDIQDLEQRLSTY